MSGYSKRTGHNKQRYQPFTEVALAKMSDDELKKLYLDIRSIVNKGKRQKSNVKNSEIDLCYVQREVQLRKLR